MRTKAGIRRRTPRGQVLFLLTMLAMAFLRPPAARAQMLPFVPDPVTTPEFVRYADMLGLSSEQRLAALDVHDAYRKEFRALEDGEVREFVRDLTGMARNFMRAGLRVPPRSDFEDLIEQLDGIITKAKTIDRGLLDRLAPLLTAEQLESLPSIRIERELDVYAHLMDGPGGFNPAAPVVLSALVRDLDLTGEEIIRTEPLLRQYERNAIQRMRKLYRILQDAATLALDTLDRTGVRDMTPLELMQLGQDEEFQENLRATFDDGSRPLQAELFEASQQNLAVLRQLTPLLSEPNADTLRDVYYRAAYARVYDHRAPWRFAYDRALAIESLDAERREQVLAQQDRFRRQEDQLVDRIVGEVEAWREYRTVEQLEADETEDMERSIASYREDRDTIDDSARATLRSILTPEQWASIAPAADDGEAAPNEVMVRTIGGPGGGGGGRAVESEVVVEDANEMRLAFGIPGVPAAMSLDRRDHVARLAGLDEGQRAVLESLFDDYRAEYAAALDAMTQEDEKDEQQAGADNGAAVKAKKEEERRTARLATLAAIDEVLFESTELAFDGEGVRRAVGLARGLRARERATAATQAAFIFGREESYTDFVAVVLAMERSVDIVTAMTPALVSYGEEMGPLVDERLVAVHRVNRQFRLASRMEEHGRPGKRRAKEITANAEESRQRVRMIDGLIRQANRRLLAEMESALDSDLGWTLRVAYQRAAYPEIYEDELGLDDAMVAVRALEDLTPSQQTRVENIVNDYRAGFMGLSERMVRLRSKRDFDFSVMQMPSQEMIEGEIELERLRFDRREAGARAILRLRLVLSGDQIARCGLREVPMAPPRAFD